MAPKEQPGSLARPLYFPVDPPIDSELPWVTLSPPGKAGACWLYRRGALRWARVTGAQTALVRPSPGKGTEQMGIGSGTSLWRKSFVTRGEDRECRGRDPSGSQAKASRRRWKRSAALHGVLGCTSRKQEGLLTLPGSSKPLGDDFSSRNLISAKHRQLFPRASKGR